jgi:hypothetical protein
MEATRKNPNCLVLAGNEAQVKFLKDRTGRNTQVVSMCNEYALRGVHKPLIIDNGALTMLLCEVDARIGSLEHSNEALTDKADALFYKNKTLTEYVEKLKAENERLKEESKKTQEVLNGVIEDRQKLGAEVITLSQSNSEMAARLRNIRNAIDR